MAKVIALLLHLATPAAAEDNPLKWASEHQALADHLSTAAVLGNLGGQTITEPIYLGLASHAKLDCSAHLLCAALS